MKGLFSILIAIFTVCIFSEFALGCTCINDSLSKRFKKANAVFVGGVADIEGQPPSNIQNYRKGLPVLLVKRAWKGVRKDFVAIDFDFTDASTGCPMFYKFEEDKDYLVFAYGNQLKVKVGCSDTWALRTEYDSTIKDISKLNSFWFRTRLRLWPF